MKPPYPIILSIIIVNYKTKDDLFVCLDSIEKSDTKVRYEILIVDNDEKTTLKTELQKEFPLVTYIKSPKNVGYGKAANLAAHFSKGKFLFFLNPDTIIKKNALHILADFLGKNKSAAMVSALLLDEKGVPYPLQGTKELTPLRGVVVLSFLNKLFPHNFISQNYWLLNWNKKSLKDVDVAPGAACMVRKDVFFQAGMFDERFFLFFEEHDLCKRIKNLGFRICMVPQAKVVHLWGRSMHQTQGIEKIFSQSRFLYFSKHFGLFSAILVHCITSISKTHVLLAAILLLASFLRFFQLSKLMMFIGDFGWFYLSARDFILGKHFPLVGITTSHTWLHQGPLWTYILAVALWIFRFNPLGGVYLTSLFGIITVWLVYKTASLYFSKKVGLIAASFYSASPLIIIHARMPYHTSLIPFFITLLMVLIYKLTHAKHNIFPFIIIVLALLYNLELATVILWFVLMLVIAFGFWKKQKWAMLLIDRKILLVSLFGFIFIMLPVFVYDVSHGFVQTLGFTAWIPYKIATTFYNIILHTHSLIDFGSFFSFLYLQQNRLLFLPSGFISLLIFCSSIVFYILSALPDKKNQNRWLFFLFFLIPFLGFVASNTLSEAYLPIVFPSIVILFAFFVDGIIRNNYLKTGVVVFFVISNSISCISHNYLMGRNGVYGPTFIERINRAQEIVKGANGKDYNLIGSGKGSQFKSFTMNYEYLTWWLGNGSSYKNERLKFILREDNGTIYLNKKGL